MTAYKDLTEEEKKIIIEKNLRYYYNNRQKIKVRTYIYFREYYRKNHMMMLERARQNRHKNYDIIPKKTIQNIQKRLINKYKQRNTFKEHYPNCNLAR